LIYCIIFYFLVVKIWFLGLKCELWVTVTRVTVVYCGWDRPFWTQLDERKRLVYDLGYFGLQKMWTLGYCNSGYGSFRETRPPNMDSARREEAIGIWFGRFWVRRYTTLQPLSLKVIRTGFSGFYSIEPENGHIDRYNRIGPEMAYLTGNSIFLAENGIFAIIFSKFSKFWKFF
jgi:hypothetical protein